MKLNILLYAIALLLSLIGVWLFVNGLPAPVPVQSVNAFQELAFSRPGIIEQSTRPVPAQTEQVSLEMVGGTIMVIVGFICFWFGEKVQQRNALEI